MRWPWQRPEARSEDATAQLIRSIQALAEGGLRDGGALAVVEACSGLWERALASASVAPDSAPLRAVSPPCLALAGRMLAIRGEAVFVLAVEGGTVSLLPCSTWSLQGYGDPGGWLYRVDVAGPSRTTSRMVPAAGVVHFRVNGDARRPWRGVSPLERANATASLGAAVEKSLTAELRVPVARILALAGNSEQVAYVADSIRKGGIVATGIGQGAADQVPTSRWTPGRIGPEPEAVTEAVRTQAGRDLCAAFGVPPSLFATTGDGAGQREAWRRFWAGTVAPLGRVVEAELRDKLDGMAAVAFPALRASDEDGRSRAVSRRAVAFKTLVDAGIGRERAMQIAGLA